MSKIVIKQLIEKVEKSIEFKKNKQEDVSDLWSRVLPYLTVLKIENSLSELKTVLNLKGGLSIEYDFIPEIKVRNQLIKDNQRMENVYFDDSLKDNERFLTFCYFAFIQIEEIINYFFIKKHMISNVVNENDIVVFYNKLNPNTDSKNYNEVPNYEAFKKKEISSKIYAFNRHFASKGGYNWDLIDELRDVRNNISHRASILIKPSTFDIYPADIDIKLNEINKKIDDLYKNKQSYSFEKDKRELNKDKNKLEFQKVIIGQDYPKIRALLERLSQLIKADLGL